MFCLDECGGKQRLHQEHGRAGSRHHRTSIISASQDTRLVASFVFAGSGNTEVVAACFEKAYLPPLPKDSVIVLDNARFHQSPGTQKLVAEAGCGLLFLPTYSPDLNPIEHLWDRLKAARRRLLPNSKKTTLSISNMVNIFLASYWPPMGGDFLP